MTNPTPLSPAAQAVWDAFNEDEAGVFVDYGDKLAAALRAAINQIVHSDPLGNDCCIDQALGVRADFLALAAELENIND